MNNNSQPHQPRKRFGQHFLTDISVLQHIANSIAAQKNQHLVEIGPGQGALTETLITHSKQLDVIEIDTDLVRHLQLKFENQAHLHIHQGDALKFDFCSLANKQPIRVVGNLPYNISTPLLIHLWQQQHCIEDMHFLLQKEIVERLTAAISSSNYSRLTVIAQYYCQTQLLFTVTADAFDPPPKVESAFVYLKPLQREHKASDIKQFHRLVQIAFNQRRKTISNSLKSIVGREELIRLGIDPSLRPQALSVDDYIKISNAVSLSL